MTNYFVQARSIGSSSSAIITRGCLRAIVSRYGLIDSGNHNVYYSPRSRSIKLTAARTKQSSDVAGEAAIDRLAWTLTGVEVLPNA